jgi:hypothetical protein
MNEDEFMTELTLNFTATITEMNIILGALAKRPFEEVAGLLPRLQQDAQKQLQLDQPTAPLID